VKRTLDLEELDRYATGELGDDAAEAFEEAMFDAADDPGLEIVDRIARHGARLAAHGTFDMGVTREHIDALRARGVTVQLVDGGAPEAPGTRKLTLDRTSELIATRLPLGRSDLPRVDVEMVVVAFDNASKTIKDVFVDQTDGAIYGLCERALAEIVWGNGATTVRVREPHGDHAVIAEWHFEGVLAAS
jgi:hypothetical protein